jgi:O-antigen/teichoic acid export membrane protein
VTLKDKTTAGLFWSFFQIIGQQAVRFIISIVLARLLLPREFGLMGMLTLFIALGEIFINSGFGRALIQKKDATQKDICTMFYFNIFVGFLCALLLFSAAPWIGKFYRTPVLVPLARVMSLGFIINSFGLIQSTLLTKRVEFKTQLKVNLSATLFFGGVGILMAWRGFGVWSLAVQSLGTDALIALLYWICRDWRPSAIFSWTSLKSMFGFGSKLLLSRIINTAFTNIYLVVIGRLFSASELAFYWRASQIQELPATNIGQASERVLFPVFSSLQGDPERLKRAFRKTLTGMAMVNFPIMVGLAVTAKSFVLAVLTEKWAPCIPLLRLLCVVGAFFPLQLINLSALTAFGRSDLFLRLEIIKNIVVVIAIAATFHFGVKAMIYGQIATSFICYYLNSYYSGRFFSYPLWQQVYDLLPYLGTALLMGVVVYFVQWLPLTSQWSQLGIQVATGIFTYLAICRILRLNVFQEGMEVIAGMTNRFKSAWLPAE